MVGPANGHSGFLRPGLRVDQPARWATQTPRLSTEARAFLMTSALDFVVRGGFWFDCCRTHGIEADYIGLSEENDKHGAVSGGLDTFSRPYIDAITNTNNVEFVAFLPTAPNPLAGSGAIAGGILIGAESNFSMGWSRFVRNLREELLRVSKTGCLGRVPLR